MGRRRIGQQFHDRQCGGRLAGAGLADQRERLALADVEGDPVDCQHLTVAMAERHRQIANRKQRRCRRVHGAHLKVLRGSNASRTASPMKIRSDIMMAMVKNPEIPSHGAWMFDLPCCSISPSDGEPGGRPKPRKSSAVSSMTAPDRMNGSIVMVATMALGKRWRNMMTRLETPSARAAW